MQAIGKKKKQGKRERKNRYNGKGVAAGSKRVCSKNRNLRPIGCAGLLADGDAASGKRRVAQKRTLGESGAVATVWVWE